MNRHTLPLFLAAASAALTSHAAPVILNEYNAGGSTDPTGDWFEIVVVGSGIAGSTVDMRGYQFEFETRNQTTNQMAASGTLQLSFNSYWSNVQAGTIITFHEKNSSTTGRDTAILAIDNFATEGWAHTNVWMGDIAYIGSFVSLQNDLVNQHDTVITIKNGAGALVFGPVGEGTAAFKDRNVGGVGSDEVFKLEENPWNPNYAITPGSNYEDGTTSTFGAPNQWDSTTGNLQVQDFSVFIIPEPGSTLLTLVGGVVALTSLRRRRRS